MSGRRTVRILGLIDEVYYAPQVVAFRLGFFADEGLDVEWSSVGDPEGLPRAIAQGKADFALGGLWQPWVYRELGEPFVAFASLNQQVPLFLFAREPRERFEWTRLNGGKLLHTSVMAPSPWCALQELLRVKDVGLGALNLVLGFPQPESRALFRSGRGELLELFGLGAAPLLREGDLHLVADWEADVGRIPWSVYFTTRERLRDLEREAVLLTRALARAERWLAEHTADEATEVLSPWFGDVDEGDVDVLVRAFLATDQWPGDPALDRESVERWRTYLVRSGLLTGTSPYEEIVAPEIAAQATEEAG